MPVRKDLSHIPRTMSRGSSVFCINCQKYKDRSSFYANTKTPTKCSSWCKDCTRTYYKERRNGNRNDGSK